MKYGQPPAEYLPRTSAIKAGKTENEGAFPQRAESSFRDEDLDETRIGHGDAIAERYLQDRPHVVRRAPVIPRDIARAGIGWRPAAYLALKRPADLHDEGTSCCSIAHDISGHSIEAGRRIGNGDWIAGSNSEAQADRESQRRELAAVGKIWDSDGCGRSRNDIAIRYRPGSSREIRWRCQRDIRHIDWHKGIVIENRYRHQQIFAVGNLREICRVLIHLQFHVPGTEHERRQSVYCRLRA